MPMSKMCETLLSFRHFHSPVLWFGCNQSETMGQANQADARGANQRRTLKYHNETGFHTQMNFSEYYLRFGHEPSKRLVSHILGWVSLTSTGF